MADGQANRGGGAASRSRSGGGRGSGGGEGGGGGSGGGGDGATTKELMAQFTDEMSTLMRKELELARAELGESARRSAVAGGMLGGAAVCTTLVVAALHGGFLRALQRRLSPMGGGIVAALCYGLAAAGLGKAGIEELRRRPPSLARTTETLKEDVQWAAHPTRSAAQ